MTPAFPLPNDKQERRLGRHDARLHSRWRRPTPAHSRGLFWRWTAPPVQRPRHATVREADATAIRMRPKRLPESTVAESRPWHCGEVRDLKPGAELQGRRPDQ